jgi:hypothetical protein
MGLGFRGKIFFKDINGKVADRFAVISKVEGSMTGVAETSENIASGFALAQNYPNPFNPSTTIRFRLAKAAPTKLVILNLMGQPVRTLFKGDIAAGEREIEWDAHMTPVRLFRAAPMYMPRERRRSSKQRADVPEIA